MEHSKNARSILLTRDTYYEVVHDLWRALPPPLSDDPEELAFRDNDAMATVASLRPADPADAALAGQFVAASAHAMDCLGQVNEHAAEPAVAMKCLAQATSMIRQTCMARSLLLKIQEARRKRSARGDTSANDPARSDLGMPVRMAEALRQAPQAETEAGREGGTIPGTTEQALSQRDADPSAASAWTDARVEGVPAAQFVSYNENLSQNHSNETSVRRGSLAYLPPKRNLPASAAVTAAIHRTPHAAGPMQRA